MIQIPITNQPNQSFEIVIPKGNENISLAFSIYWNRIAGYWQMNIASVPDRRDLIVGLPLITGRTPAGNILKQWEYLEIGQAYVVPISDDAPDTPGVDGWGTTHVLIWEV